jgi:hypothetical protein
MVQGRWVALYYVASSDLFESVRVSKGEGGLAVAAVYFSLNEAGASLLPDCVAGTPTLIGN